MAIEGGLARRGPRPTTPWAPSTAPLTSEVEYPPDVPEDVPDDVPEDVLEDEEDPHRRQSPL